MKLHLPGEQLIALPPRRMTDSSVPWETWTDVQRLPLVSDEYPLQDHLLHWPIILIQQAVSLRTSEHWMCRCLPSVTDLKLCLTGHLCADASPPHCDECPLQDHILIKPVILTQQALFSGSPENEHMEASPVSVTISSVSWETWMCRSFPMSVMDTL